MKRLLKFVFPFTGLLITFIFIKTISVVAYAENIPTALNASWKSNAIVAFSPSTSESAIVVNTLEDELNSDGDCSLREAIISANNNTPTDACPSGDGEGKDTITFAKSGLITQKGYINITAGGELMVDGGGNITISGNSSVFYVNTNAEITLSGLTISDNFSADSGGGISNNGTLSVIDSILSNNHAVNGGGGIANSGTLTITNTTLSGNSAGAGGGGIANSGKLYVSKSTLSGNSAGTGGGIYSTGTFTLSNTTLSGNSAYHSGGINIGGPSTIINSTLLGNSADVGSGGGIGFQEGPWIEPIIAINTIIANSTSGFDCEIQMITDGGHNIDTDGSCGFSPVNGSMPHTNPLLEPLHDNGGATWTHALRMNSPAIDATDQSDCPLTDQRGVIRPTDGDGDGNGACDIGSYELVGPLTPIFLPLVVKNP